MLAEAKSLTNPLEKSITRNLMMSMAQPDQVLLPTKILGSLKLLVGIATQFSTHKENQTDPTIQ